MPHPIHRVVNFTVVAPYTILVEFEDGTNQTIDFQPVLAGERLGPHHGRSCATLGPGRGGRFR